MNLILKVLKVNQKISFFSDENQILKKIIIDLDFKTILIINLSKNLEVTKKELNTFLILSQKNILLLIHFMQMVSKVMFLMKS